VSTQFRILPRVTPDTEFFWTAGRDGVLRFLRCQDCGYYIHPPTPVCPRCLSRSLAPEAVSGRASVATYTINHQRWIPGYDPPYIIAIVEIEEQPSVRLMTNLVDCPIDQVRVGLPVEVRFEAHDDVWLPLFVPAGGAE
jgi:uncharacterized OB-fold protein